MALSDSKILEIVNAKKLDIKNRQEGKVGKSNRDLAEQILGSRKAESTIRRVWKAHRHENLKTENLKNEKIGKSDVIQDDYSLEEVSESALDAKIKYSEKEYAKMAKQLRTAQRTNSLLRKINRGFADGTNEKQENVFEDVIGELSKNLEGKFYEYKAPKITKCTEKTVEILFGDWQFGKVSESWDSKIAAKASVYYGQELVKIINEIKPERIIFTALGDNIEDFMKHGIQSAVSTDSSNAEQTADCIEKVWFNILAPLVEFGIPMDFVGVVGNHGSSEHKGMDMFKAGRFCTDYALYKTWENMCKIVKADHVTFNLPEGHFATYDIYGKLTLAEHGYECKGSSEAALIGLRNKRSTNLQTFINRVVVGDMHHYCNYDNGNLQVNGSAFGVAFNAIEYSGIMGFHAVPCQIVNVHEKTTGVGQNTVTETKVIQIAKGY